MTHLVLFGKGASSAIIICGDNDGEPAIPIAKSKLMARRWRFLKRYDVSAIVTRKNINDSVNDPVKRIRIINQNLKKMLPLRTCLFL